MTYRIILTIDVGPDGASVGKGHESEFTWSKTQEGIEKLTEAFIELSNRYSIKMPATWFIRSDQVIYETFGSYSALFDQVSKQLGTTMDTHELGWLPQVYTIDGHDNSLANDIGPTVLQIAHEALCDAGYSIKSTRMGDCYHTNQTMGILNHLRIKYDCSALPHRVKNDGGWDINWSLTGNSPYQPSVNDYRVPGTPGYELIEIPLTMIPIKADYDDVPLSRYLNPCYKEKYLWQNAKRVIENSDYIHCVMHPDEVIQADKSHAHPLVAYSYNNVIDNLLKMVEICMQEDDDVEFCTVSDFGNHLKESGD
jgi:hypothetical protein